MVLKTRSFAFMLLVMILFSGVVYGQNPKTSSYADGVLTLNPSTTPSTENAMSTTPIIVEEAPGVYKPDTVNSENPNLLIGGIRQISSDPNKNTEKEMADQIGAIYVPTYYSGPAKDQADELVKVAGDALEVNKAASCAKPYEATYKNGLSSDVLKGPKTYNTIVAYSGGTVSAVTALDKQDVRCHTLILISPMIGMVPATTASFYKQQIKRLLENGAVQRIVVIQSSDDQPPADNLYEAKFTKGEMSGVDVYDVDLRTTGIDAHKEIFYEYAKDHLELNKNGQVYYSEQPISQKTSSAFSKNPFSNSKLAQWGIGSPMLSPTSDTSGLSGQNKDGTDETSGTSYINKAKNDVWYVDMNAPTFVNKIAHFNPAFDWSVKPPIPMYLPSGELNTYGYDFIDIPGINVYFTNTYLNWVGTYLNSIGGGSNGGYGLLLDEDRNGGGGW